MKVNMRTQGDIKKKKKKTCIWCLPRNRWSCLSSNVHSSSSRPGRGWALFSLIKMFKEPTLFYYKQDQELGTVCASALFVTRHCHYRWRCARPKKRSHTFLRTQTNTICLSLASMHASECAARARKNQTVDTQAPRTHTEALAHTVTLGWYVEDLVTHCLFNFKKKKSWGGGWEHLGQRGHINRSKSYATSLLTLYAAFTGHCVWDISSSGLLKGGRRPPCSVLTLFLGLLYGFNDRRPNNFLFFFQDCTIVYLFLFICSHQNVEGENVGRERGEKKEGDHILASARWYVALSFWILLSTLDRQLNKKTHRLPMCLHRSWFSWKQWEDWNAEHAKPWSGVWGWVHHIYTGPQARGGKRLLCTRKVPLSPSPTATSLRLSLLLHLNTLPSINWAAV